MMKIESLIPFPHFNVLNFPLKWSPDKHSTLDMKRKKPTGYENNNGIKSIKLFAEILRVTFVETFPPLGSIFYHD